MSCRFALLLISFSRCAAFYRFRTRAGCPTLPQQALLMGTESTECSAAGGRNARGRCRSPFDPHAPVIEEGRSAGRRESLEPQVLSQFLPTFVWSQKWVAPGRETPKKQLARSSGTSPPLKAAHGHFLYSKKESLLSSDRRDSSYFSYGSGKTSPLHLLRRGDA